ncbi:uncharacterized protein LY89DRAFT_339069 [Mollisia scopiformis]|uniref:Maturase K n=1 Tax=Mollisia scopiformis TaxID=149040 RepID=A0A132B8P6_MOLSC|nr:uncharacterized protein LY89DRAFT_339069 [Mollisia scopiformis]KUJ08254.1 hypothetical protein LY89DRAFT_339069 [Mollisia scopiformis]
MPFPFLSLPFEIRLLIYAFYINAQTQTKHYINSETYIERCTRRSFTINAFELLQRTLERRYRHLLRAGWISLCLASHQLYEEMLPFIHCHPIRLTLVDDLFFNHAQDQLFHWPSQHPWLVANVKEIRLHLTFSGRQFRAYGTELEQAAENDLLYDMPSLTSVYPSEMSVRLMISGDL